MDFQSSNPDSASDGFGRRYSPKDTNETSTFDSTNSTYNSSADSSTSKGTTDLKRNQQNPENIISKTKKLLQQQWEHTRQSLVQLRRKVNEMIPKQAYDLIYWKNPILSGIVFGVSLSVIITFMFLSSLAAISFWLLALLVVIGLNKLFVYVMVTFVGRIHEDVFESIFPADTSITEQQAREWANCIRTNGNYVLKHGRNLFLWGNLMNSILFGFVLFLFFYIGLSMNALTFALIALIFLFTVPKIYQVYQVPIDRTAKKVLDQINQLLAKVTSKIPNKAKTN